MKLLIKTLNQKSLVIDIEDTKTVLDLKKELALYPDVGVQPELQKLIYAGKILTNADQLSAYNIDVKKFLVVMILKQPLQELVTGGSGAAAATTSTAAATTSLPAPTTPVDADKANSTFASTTASSSSSGAEEFKTPPVPKAKPETSALVQNIVSMGYPEDMVRRALEASFNNPERAIEYLIEGIPSSPATPEGAAAYTDDTDGELSPFEVFRSDPLFQNLRRAIQQHPDLLNDAIKHVGETNPSILSLINENQQEFLSMLIEASDDEDDDDEMDDEDDD